MESKQQISIIAIHGNGAGLFLANKVIGHKSLDHNKNIRHGS